MPSLKQRDIASVIGKINGIESEEDLTKVLCGLVDLIAEVDRTVEKAGFLGTCMPLKTSATILVRHIREIVEKQSKKAA